MGHELTVHRRFYRLQDDVIELAKVSKLLIAVEEGRAAQFSGRTMDDIGLEDISIDEGLGARRKRATNVTNTLPRNLSYDGKRNWAVFKQRFVYYAEACEWTKKECLNCLCWSLTGAAADFYAVLTDHKEHLSYHRLMRKLESRFGAKELPATAQMPLSRAEIQKRYREKKKAESGSFLKKERERKRKAYIPTSLMSQSEAKKRRADTLVRVKRHIQKKKVTIQKMMDEKKCQTRQSSTSKLNISLNFSKKGHMKGAKSNTALKEAFKSIQDLKNEITEPEISSDENDSDLIKVESGDYCAALYDGEWYVGLVTARNEKECKIKVNFMEEVGNIGDSFRWPTKRNEIWIPIADVITKVPEPHQSGKRRRLFKLGKEIVDMIEWLCKKKL